MVLFVSEISTEVTFSCLSNHFIEKCHFLSNYTENILETKQSLLNVTLENGIHIIDISFHSVKILNVLNLRISRDRIFNES